MTTMRTTVTLDDDVYEAVRAHAQATGKRLGQVLSEMARQALQPSGQRPKRAVKTGEDAISSAVSPNPRTSSSESSRT